MSARALGDGTYRPEGSIVFVTRRPKYREVHAAPYRDRVVQHLLHRQLEPRLEPGFISDSYACRRGKGTHGAARRLQSLMWRCSRHGGRRVYALKMDVRSFFMAIHKPTLLGPLRRHFSPLERGPRVAHSPWSLTQVLLREDTAGRARRRGLAADFERVPAHKRLGALGPERGLPIGNLTSQCLANLYLGALDTFVKRTLGARCYVRYVDDFVLLHHDESVLRAWQERIRDFLAVRLKLEAHPVASLTSVGAGVDFVGYIVRPGYLLPRRRVVRNLQVRLVEAEQPLRPRVLDGGETVHVAGVGLVEGPCRLWPIDGSRIEALRATWASYLGHLRHASAHRLRRRLWAAHFLSSSLLRNTASSVTRRFALGRSVPHYAAQLERLRQGLDGAVLLVQVGRALKCPGLGDCHRLGLRLRSLGRRRLGAGVPLSAAASLVQRALDRGLRVAVALEGSVAAGGVRERAIRWWLEPLPRVAHTGQFLLPL